MPAGGSRQSAPKGSQAKSDEASSGIFAWDWAEAGAAVAQAAISEGRDHARERMSPQRHSVAI